MTTHLNSFGLKDGWLDSTTDAYVARSGAASVNYCHVQGGTSNFGASLNGQTGTLTTNAHLNTTAYVWPYQQTYGWYYYPVTDSRPIKLAMSEIAKLRQAAKRDAKLKAILAKFTDQIEVTVDFE